ncbi:MAG: M3 family peptidase, partial [Pseudomonadota bacterium]
MSNPSVSFKARLIIACAAGALAWGCGAAETPSSTDGQASAAVEAENPLITEWPGTYATPPFSAISDEDYKPAFDAAVAEYREELEAIASLEDAPTFENTIVAMEQAGGALKRVGGVFFNVTNTDTNPTLQELDVELTPAFTREVDAPFLDDRLFARVQAVYDAQEGLAPEDARLVELYHREFVRKGAAADAEAKSRIKEINTRIATLNTQFAQNLLKETKSFQLVVTDPTRLAGLSDAMKAAGKSAAEAAGLEDA